jgi:ribosomal protein L37AE/L43A
VNRDEEDVDALDLYGHIVEEVMAGRAEGHKCPVCADGVLDCTLDEAKIVLKCPRCGRFFEGRLA